MYSAATLARKYLRYYLKASNGKGHGVHSPFVFDFIVNVLNDRQAYGAYGKVESLRKSLLRDNTKLSVSDLGAGSGVDKGQERSIASIARHAAKPKKYGQLLHRVAKHYDCRQIVELGTSLGISTAYLATSGTAAEVITLEGAPSVAEQAKRNFETLGLENVQMVLGNFDDTLPGVLSRMRKVDLCFIDGNHRQEPTERYFAQVRQKLHNDSIVILDDIHWSEEMEAAWTNCRESSAVTLSIDLFFIGILVFRKEIREKQHFTIRF